MLAQGVRLFKAKCIEIKMTQYLLFARILSMGSTPKTSPLQKVKEERKSGEYRAKRGSG